MSAFDISSKGEFFFLPVKEIKTQKSKNPASTSSDKKFVDYESIAINLLKNGKEHDYKVPSNNISILHDAAFCGN